MSLPGMSSLTAGVISSQQERREYEDHQLDNDTTLSLSPSLSLFEVKLSETCMSRLIVGQ